MIRIGIFGDIGSGKSFVAKNFGYPVFNADDEVSYLYKYDKKIFIKLKKILPKYFKTFPIDKKKISEAIFEKQGNLKKIINIVHKEVRKRLSIFLIKNNKKKIVVLDIPLLLENNLNYKKDYLVFVQSKKKDILARLRKRKNFNFKMYKLLKEKQFSTSYKKKKSHFTIKNDFTKRSIKKQINKILKEIV